MDLVFRESVTVVGRRRGWNAVPMRWRAAAAAVVVASSPIACDSDDAARSRPSTTSTTDLRSRVRADLGALHRSTIREVPGLVALFYHHPEGWAVEDTSFDAGATWCRHAWYRWDVVETSAPDAFTIRYTPTSENPSCAPLGAPLVLDVRERTRRDGADVLVGEYRAGLLHNERTVCPGTLAEWRDVCGESSGLGPPTPVPARTLAPP
jgi:hypothetical protein